MFLSLLPLFLAAVFGFLGVFWYLEEKQKVLMLCERRILAAQTELLRGGHQLIDLNPQVQALVLEKQALRTAMAVAATPAEKAALATQLMIVIFKIRALRAEQQLITISAEAAALRHLIAIEQGVRSEARYLKYIWRGETVTGQTRFSPPRIRLEKRFSDLSIPTHHPPLNFSERQTLSADLKFHSFRLFPAWLGPLAKGRMFWQENCSSHPRRGGMRWQSYLGRGRSL